MHGKLYIRMDNTQIRLTIFFAAKDGEALYSQKKQDKELTVAQIITVKFSCLVKSPAFEFM